MEDFQLLLHYLYIFLQLEFRDSIGDLEESGDHVGDLDPNLSSGTIESLSASGSVDAVGVKGGGGVVALQHAGGVRGGIEIEKLHAVGGIIVAGHSDFLDFFGTARGVVFVLAVGVVDVNSTVFSIGAVGVVGVHVELELEGGAAVVREVLETPLPKHVVSIVHERNHEGLGVMQNRRILGVVASLGGERRDGAVSAGNAYDLLPHAEMKGSAANLGFEIVLEHVRVELIELGTASGVENGLSGVAEFQLVKREGPRNVGSIADLAISSGHGGDRFLLVVVEAIEGGAGGPLNPRGRGGSGAVVVLGAEGEEHGLHHAGGRAVQVDGTGAIGVEVHGIGVRVKPQGRNGINEAGISLQGLGHAERAVHKLISSKRDAEVVEGRHLLNEIVHSSVGVRALGGSRGGAGILGHGAGVEIGQVRSANAEERSESETESDGSIESSSIDGESSLNASRGSPEHEAERNGSLEDSLPGTILHLMLTGRFQHSLPLRLVHALHERPLPHGPPRDLEVGDVGVGEGYLQILDQIESPTGVVSSHVNVAVRVSSESGNLKRHAEMGIIE